MSRFASFCLLAQQLVLLAQLGEVPSPIKIAILFTAMVIAGSLGMFLGFLRYGKKMCNSLVPPYLNFNQHNSSTDAPRTHRYHRFHSIHVADLASRIVHTWYVLLRKYLILASLTGLYLGSLVLINVRKQRYMT